jgi:phage-related protein
MRFKSQFAAVVLLGGCLCLPRFAAADNQNRGRNDQNRAHNNDRNHLPPGRAQNNAPPPGKWLREHLNQPPQEQQRELQSDPDFKRLTPQQQEHLQQRLNQFNSLPPQRQQRILNRMQRVESLPPDKQQLLRNSLQQFKQLPDDRRRQVRRAWNSLSQMPPDQQEQVINSDRFRSDFNDEERATLKGLLDSGFNPGENNGPH